MNDIWKANLTSLSLSRHALRNMRTTAGGDAGDAAAVVAADDTGSDAGGESSDATGGDAGGDAGVGREPLAQRRRRRQRKRRAAEEVATEEG